MAKNLVCLPLRISSRPHLLEAKDGRVKTQGQPGVLCSHLEEGLPGGSDPHWIWLRVYKFDCVKQNRFQDLLMQHCQVHPNQQKLYILCVCVCDKSLQSCPTLCNPVTSPPGSSVRGILQARILEWAAMPFFKGSS